MGNTESVQSTAAVCLAVQHCGAQELARPVPQLSPGQPQVRSAAAGKEPSGEAIQCEEKPISCSQGCFAQRFTKCADATALPRWDINTKLVDVD